MIVNISILPVEDTQKKHRVYYTVYTSVISLAFEQIPEILNKNYNYSPFVYKGNKRLKELIISNTNIVILDVDKTLRAIQDMHQFLKNELKSHIIATTSNSENLYKYRILLPLSREVTKEEYPNLVKGIIDYGLVEDTDLQGSKNTSQMFFAYANNPVIITYFSGEPLCVNDYLVTTKNQVFSTKLITKNCISIIDTFKSPTNQKGNSTLVRASFEILRSGYTYDEFVKCIKQLNDAWVFPMNESRLFTTIINPFKKRFNK